MLGRSIVSQHFMEPEGSIPNSQQLSTCSYPEPDQSSPHQATHMSQCDSRIGILKSLLITKEPLSIMVCLTMSVAQVV
jgi:hypothetical protein